ncbi:MAG: glutamate synthase large subunit, partial [Rhodobacteraceae bacterium]|nr:glutamate synthase large subunit [Paracoccaceae bacterium]
MTKYDQSWVDSQNELRNRMEETGMYRATDEHSACGVGLVVAIDGKPRRQVVENGISALQAIWHRGAVDADGKTGDGAGILLQIPVAFFQEQVERTGHTHKDELLAVGMIFLPRTDFGAQEACRTIVETEVLRMGYYIYGWRHVPVDVSCLGEKANATRPEVEQILISNSKGVDEETFERELYVIRRRIEKAAASINEFYICSMSCRSVIYKGMMLAEQVAVFYPDLMDERFVSAYAIYHQRYSTNTFPQWWLAQPFRMLAHNGEINTLKGNINWMKSHEIRMASASFGDTAEDIKPVVAAGSSDSAALDSVFELMVRAGRSAPMVKTMLVPESWSNMATAIPKSWQDMYAYCNAVMEPWDGPAALAMTDGQWVCAGLDRNGLRPMRYVVTTDGLVIAGSEAGMVVVKEADILEKGALGPGQMLAIDTAEGKLWHDAELKDMLAASRPFGEWASKILNLEKIVGNVADKVEFSGEELRKRQIAAGYTLEELENILHPMAEDGKESLASMGDDTPSAVLSEKYRPLSHFFRQNFSQVTNPPIDSLREFRVMSLKTRFGNLKNVLDQSSAQTETVLLESPFVSNALFAEMIKYFGDTAVEINCTFPKNDDASALQDNLTRVRLEAEEAVRAGATHLVLTDEHQDEANVPMPMILATSAVHSWLTEKGLRTFTSINVRSAECIDPQYFAVLIGGGATTVNAYLAEDSLADRVARGLLETTHAVAVERYREAINQGLLKVMSKMGISVISSYRGGLNFEAVGLSRAMVSEYFPGMISRISGIGVAGIQQKISEVHAKGWLSGQDVLPI